MAIALKFYGQYFYEVPCKIYANHQRLKYIFT